MAADPLASWNQTATRTATLKFAEHVTTSGGPGFVPPEERIAVFDNDGTLWTESPNRPALRLLVLHDDPDREFDYVKGAERRSRRSRRDGRSSA